jgi:hypothetical protein
VALTELKFDTGSFYESAPNLVKIGPKTALHVKTKIHIIVAGDIKSPYKRCARVKWYQAVRIGEGV